MILFMLTGLFENLGFIVACAIGYRVGKALQHRLTRKEFLQLLIIPVHLKDPKRQHIIKTGLKTHISWILLSM